MSTFIPYQPQQANQGFQQGWNMIMNLYGQRQLAERTEQQQKQFQQQFGLQKQQFDQESKVRDLELKELKRKQEASEKLTQKTAKWEEWLSKYQETHEGKMPSNREIAIRRALLFPEEGIPKILENEPKKDKWTAPQDGLDETGMPIVYRVNEEGDVDILKGIKPSPKRGMKIFDREGNLIVDTTLGSGNGKVMPASEVGKIGEFKAYQGTLEDIQKMINTGDIDTGPFEFIKEKIDNWGIATKGDRIQLRSLVARLPGLMYAMRGKQLSDKELEVALKMMPKMNTTEEVFINDTKLFADYMNKVLSGKKEAFGGAGYGTGAFPENKKKSDMDSFWE